MANYQRYQTLSSAEQYLFSASCPVWVSRYQISWDTQTGARLLQTRMVNLSEKAITAVYLRVRCRDSQDQELTTLHLVPVTGLMVMPGEVFGDDKIVQLWPGRTAFAEIFAERVCYSDGTAWNESEPTDYFAIPAPKPVRPTDAAYPRLALTAREGGVRNDCYYQTALQAWLCTCGVPNPLTTLRCRHCGADRLWLEEHMNAAALLTPRPAPEPEPEPEPMKEPVKEPAPELAAPLEKFDLASYLTTEPMATPVPAEKEFPEVAPAPAAPAAPVPPQKKRHTGRIIAIVLAVLLFLGVGGWLGYRYFLKPYLGYQEAVAVENDAKQLEASAKREKLEEAIALYEKLGGYEDSAFRILACRAMIADEALRQGSYEEAYELFRALEQEADFGKLEGYADKAAQALYSRGVVNYNNGALDEAWACVEKLALEYPAYSETAQLRNSCSYKYGEQALNSAKGAADAGDYDAAKNSYAEARGWFASVEDYSNSAEMLKLCDYYLADCAAYEARDAGDPEALLGAMEQFKALGDYSNSARRRLDCMYVYVTLVADPDDQRMEDFLYELIDNGYPGAQEFYDSLYRMEVEINLLSAPDANGTRASFPSTATLEELEQLYVSYEVIGGASDDNVTIQMVYTLPGTAGGKILLNDGGGRSAVVRLYDFIPVRAAKDGVVKLQFYDAETGAELASFQITVPEETTTTDSPPTGA